MTMSVFSKERSVSSPVAHLADLCENCKQQMDGRSLLLRLPSECTPLVFFDPQYRHILDKQAYGNEGARQKGRHNLVAMSDAVIKEFLRNIERVLMPSGHLMLWVDKYIVCSCLGSILDESLLRVVDMVTWNKGRMGMGYRTRRCSEYLVILQKAPVRAKGVWQIHNIPDVWDEKISKRTHTHEKPVELQKALIRATTDIGDIVVDPAAGSYSVLVATQATNRRFVGCDIAGGDNDHS